MRERGKDTRTPTTINVKDYSPKGILQFDETGMSSYGYTGEEVFMQDESHPGYYTVVKQGNIVMGDLYLVRTTRTYSNSKFRIGPHKDWGYRDVSGDIAGQLSAVSPWNASSFDTEIQVMKDTVDINARAKMNGASMYTGEQLKDASSTLGMLKRPLRSATELLLRMEKRRDVLRKTRSFMKATADTWLEYRFGWRPLIMDIDTIMSTANAKLPPLQVSRRVVRSGAKRSYSETRPATGSHPRFGVIGTAVFKRDIRVSAGIIYRYDNGGTRGWDKVMGTRSNDLAATAWEMLPYSWVVDRFVGIGSWIQAVSTDVKVTVEGAWITTVEDASTSYSNVVASLSVGNPPEEYKSIVGGSTEKTSTVQRFVARSLPPAPHPQVNSRSWAQTTDLISAAVQQVVSGIGSFKH